MTRSGASKGRKVDESSHLVSYKGTKMERLQRLYDDWYGCEKCILHTFRYNDQGTRYSDVCFGDGNPDSPVMIIGEAPGAEEAASGIPFVGPSGRLLNQILASLSDDPTIKELFKSYNRSRKTREDQNAFHEAVLEWRKREFFITNVVACRPPENRTPTNSEVKACWPRLHNIIDIVDPWIIITCGKPAITALTHKTIEITKLRGSLFEVEIQGHLTAYRKPVMATLHPSYLLRVADYQSKTGAYSKTVRDIRRALTYVDNLKHFYFGTPIPDRPDL